MVDQHLTHKANQMAVRKHVIIIIILFLFMYVCMLSHQYYSHHLHHHNQHYHRDHHQDHHRDYHHYHSAIISMMTTIITTIITKVHFLAQLFLRSSKTYNWYNTIQYNTIDIQVLPSELFRSCLQIYIVEVRQLRVLESPLERLTC